MRENRSPSSRFICGVALCYVAFAFIAGYARTRGIFFESPRDWQSIELALSVTSGNQLAYFHWQRIAPDPSNHWSRLAFPMILHQVWICIAAFIVIHFIFKLT
ncbi:hypothetical protein RS75_12820 [Rhizobium nepotum 39/7]|uniref:Mannosyltransferase n=1 Tax=Rhizobium nepotum 39/7 TaxID=1368418 RepID=A0ABR5CRJ3_9HYPH|nr:hypothetical protein RS75_12820 [Rhizobium nepotum 39/7]